MAGTRTRIGQAGRLVIPAEYRKALGLKPGDEVLLELGEGEIRVVTVRQALRQAQALVRRYVPAGTSLSEELARERREEAARG